MKRTLIQAPGRSLAGLLSLLLLMLLLGALVGASSAAAQEATDASRDSVPEEERDPTSYSDDELYAEDEDISGFEERVVLAGESEAAAAFDSGDSVTGFNAADLEAVGAFNVADLAKFTPNLEIVTAGSTSPTFFIRGVGLNDFNPNSSGAVAIYQDDVPVNSPALQLGLLFDVEGVSIERGPVGTGPARNASAGAIRIFAKRPSGDYGATFSASYGRFNAVDVVGAVEAPIVEDIVSSRFAFRIVNRDGFAKNDCGNAPAFDDRAVRPRASDADPGDPAIATDPRWSICGETVLREGTVQGDLSRSDGKSEIPEGLPRDVNDQDVWAARGTFLIEPTLDMEFLLSAHGSRRNELSRLGQSAGTLGSFCDPDVPILDCVSGPVDQREGLISGNLGGTPNLGDGGGYLEPDVGDMYRRYKRDFDAECAPNCTATERLENINLAKIRTANKISNNLDKRPFRGDYDEVGKTKNDTWGVVLKGDIALPYGLHFDTVSGYDGYDRSNLVDLDFSPNVLFEIDTRDNAWQFAQSFALSGQIPAESPIDWTVGVFTLVEELDAKVANNFGRLQVFGVSGRKYTQDTQTVAGYFSFDWDFWESFTLDGGVRYNWDRKEIDYVLGRGGVQLFDKQTDSWDSPTGTIRLTYRFNETTHAYWKYTRGWKGGHYNATSSLVDGVTKADPEQIDSFEFGLRGSWLDGMLNLDASLFYYDYEDYQLFTVQQQLDSSPEFVVLNASDARVFGAEINSRVRPWPGASAEVRFSWLESKFLDFVQNQKSRRQVGLTSVIVNKEIDNSGNRLLNSPRFKVSFTAEQEVPLATWGNLIARYDGAWTDDTFFDATEGRGIPNSANQEFLPGNTIGQKAYWIHNLRLAYNTPDGSIELAGWVRNLANQAYKTFAFDASTFQSTTIAFVGDPRTYGVTFTVNFF